MKCSRCHERPAAWRVWRSWYRYELCESCFEAEDAERPLGRIKFGR